MKYSGLWRGVISLAGVERTDGKGGHQVGEDDVGWPVTTEAGKDCYRKEEGHLLQYGAQPVEVGEQGSITGWEVG